MRSGETLYYLEIGSRPGSRSDSRSSADVVLAEQQDAAVVRAITLAIGHPYDWPSQHWNDEDWADYMGRAGLRHWTAERGGESVGLASVRFDQTEVELDTFGLVPGHIGKGLGRTFLELVIDLAWREAPEAQRVWLHTSSADHPRALRTYQRSGFRLYRTIPPTGP